MRVALTIAGSDSGAAAGIQADLKTFAAHNVYGLTAITAVTAQNTLGVATYQALPADLVSAQIEAVVSDFGVNAAKTGMLPNAAIVEAVAAAVVDLEIPLLVVDPVMIATSGDRLLDDEAVAAMKAELFSRALTVTPNIPEAEALTGVQIRSDADRREAARIIALFGAATVIIKGGPLATPDISDLFFDGREFHDFRGERVMGGSTHGTGCSFAAAIVSHLALGQTLPGAIRMAQRYIAGAIRRAPGLGHGRGRIDPFWALS